MAVRRFLRFVIDAMDSRSLQVAMRAPRLLSDRWQPISRYSVAPSLGAGMRRRLSIDAAHSCRKSPRGALRPISGAEPRSTKCVRDAHEQIKSFFITPPRFAAFRDHRLP